MSQPPNSSNVESNPSSQSSANAAKPGLKYSVLPANHPLVASLAKNNLVRPNNLQQHNTIGSSPQQQVRLAKQPSTAAISSGQPILSAGAVQVVSGAGAPARVIQQQQQPPVVRHVVLNNVRQGSQKSIVLQRSGGKIIRLQGVQNTTQTAAVVGTPDQQQQQQQTVYVQQQPNQQSVISRTSLLNARPADRQQAVGVQKVQAVQHITAAQAKQFVQSQSSQQGSVGAASYQLLQQGAPIRMVVAGQQPAKQQQLVLGHPLQVKQHSSPKAARPTLLRVNSLPGQPVPSQLIRVKGLPAAGGGSTPQLIRINGQDGQHIKLNSLVGQPIVSSNQILKLNNPGKNVITEKPQQVSTGLHSQIIRTPNGQQFLIRQNNAATSKNAQINPMSAGFSRPAILSTAISTPIQNASTTSALHSPPSSSSPQVLLSYQDSKPARKSTPSKLQTSRPVQSGANVCQAFMASSNKSSFATASTSDTFSTSEGPRKVFLASSENGGQRLVRLDSRTLQRSNVSVGSSVPMARITSTNLNSAPEIQLSGGAGQFRLSNHQIGSSTVVGGEQIRVGPDQILNIVAPTSPRFQNMISPLTSPNLKLPTSPLKSPNQQLTSPLSSPNQKLSSPLTSPNLKLPSPNHKLHSLLTSPQQKLTKIDPSSGILKLKVKGKSQPDAGTGLQQQPSPSVQHEADLLRFASSTPNTKVASNSASKAKSRRKVVISKSGSAPCLVSPPRFDGLRFVNQDGGVIDANSAMMQGLQLLSAEGNLIRAEELPILSDSKLSPDKLTSSSGGNGLISPPPLSQSPVSSQHVKKSLDPTLSNPLVTKSLNPTLSKSSHKPPPQPDLSSLVPISPSQLGALKASLKRSKSLPHQLTKAIKKGNLANLVISPNAATTTVSSAKSAKVPKQPRAKAAKAKPRESVKARMQRYESALNVQPLVNILDKSSAALATNADLNMNELQARFLDSLEEKECNGGELTKDRVDLAKEYYNNFRPKKRFIDVSTKTTFLEPDAVGNHELLHKLLRNHVKTKKLRHALLTGEVEKVVEKKSRTRGGKSKEKKVNPVQAKILKRRKLWSVIIKKEINKGTKARNYNLKEKMANAKKLATACMRVQRQRANASQKLMKETVWRAKRIAREMQAYWRKSEREEKQLKRAQEKVQQEQRKQDIELIEAKRQQRKLNYLITQTELYAHFMAGKMGMQRETEDTILARLDSDIKEKRVRDLDYYDEAAVKASAKSVAAAAAQRQEAAKRSFEKSAKGSKPEGLSMSEAAETAGDRPQPSIFQGTLKSYQLKGMNWLCSLYDQGINGILADEMGLGKTVQSLAFLSYVAETYGIWGPFLVITPASTLHNWQQELAKFLPDFKTIPYWGSPQERKVLRGFWSTPNLHTKDASFHVVVTSYQIIVTDYKYFNKLSWQYMVLDEAQAIKSASSQRWKMLLDFKCRGRLLLSGTPIQNTMAELWSLLHFVMPALFDSHDEFKEWFSKDIEGHAEGSRGKVDQLQMSRLHMILKPFMLRRIKKDVEHELTDKVEILLYCPLTIRQKLLYAGLKQNIRIEEVLAGLGLGSGSMGGVSSLMNLVMQFRKVCNHPELFERREPRSPLILHPPAFRLPRLLALDPPSRQYHASQHHRFSIFRSDRVNSVFRATKLSSEIKEEGLEVKEEGAETKEELSEVKKVAEVKRERIEVKDNAFDFLKIVDLSPGELEAQTMSLYDQYLLIANRTVNQLQSFLSRPWLCTGSSHQLITSRPDQLISSRSEQLVVDRAVGLPSDLVFTGHCSTFLSHCDETIWPAPETISHRIHRSRRLGGLTDDGHVPLLPEFAHVARPPATRSCVPTACPAFLINYQPRAGALPRPLECSSRMAEYQRRDHERLWAGHNSRSGKELLLHGRTKEEEVEERELHYNPVQDKGLTAARPLNGWSQITIPDKLSLISDAGKLFVLDGLLTRLKEGGHRVLIYTQMTKMIDLLEEFMSHRHHSYMRLDGSSKISERRDMVADFQNRQDIFVFLLSTRAGGLGINLTAADTVIFYDSDWNPTVDQQAMDRAHRLGQTKQVTVYRLICKGTIEERILERAREKSEIHRMVIQGGSFKGGKATDLKPKEVVSLLLDEEELEKRMKLEKETANSKEKPTKSEDQTKKEKKRKLVTDSYESRKKSKNYITQIPPSNANCQTDGAIIKNDENVGKMDHSPTVKSVRGKVSPSTKVSSIDKMGATTVAMNGVHKTEEESHQLDLA